jgi:hypothetical protein
MRQRRIGHDGQQLEIRILVHGFLLRLDDVLVLEKPSIRLACSEREMLLSSPS